MLAKEEGAHDGARGEVDRNIPKDITSKSDFAKLCAEQIAEFPLKTEAEHCHTLELQHHVSMTSPERRAVLAQAIKASASAPAAQPGSNGADYEVEDAPSLASSDEAPPHIDGTAAPWQQPGSSCLHVAISYALDLNWAVFPADLRGGEKKSHKSAAYSKDGSRWGSTKDPRQISADFKRWPDAVGVPTGADNGIFVIEADTIKGHGVDGVANLDALEHQYGKLPDTLMAQSPSGSVHRYYRHPGNGISIKSRSGEFAPGVDVKGDGGMVIAPPSKRGDGHYRWLNSLPIADPPDWLLKLAVAPAAPAASDGVDSGKGGSGAPRTARNDASSFRRLNDEAVANYDRWVPKLFPEAKRQASGGWRVSSAALGRELEEDISFAPEGIKDFGVHDMGDPRGGKRTPIDVVMEWHPDLKVPIAEIVHGQRKEEFGKAVSWLWAALGHTTDWREEFDARLEEEVDAANKAGLGGASDSETKTNAGEEDLGTRSSASKSDADADKSAPKSDEQGETQSSDDIESDDLDELIRTGGAKLFGGDRSKAVWKVINMMLRLGYLQRTIIATLLDNRNGISAYVLDQKEPWAYAARQVAEAKRRIKFAIDKNGKPYVTQNSMRVALLKMGVALSYDQFADRVLVDGLKDFGPTLDDAAMTRLRLSVETRFHFLPSKEMFYDIVADVARRNKFHPVRGYLDGLQWDGVPRIDRWLITYAGAKKDGYVRAVGALTLIAAVRRVRQPGCKFDELPVLESPQGLNKSSALRVMAVHEDWFSDDLPLNASGKETIEQTRGKWLIECAELGGMRRAEIDRVKALLSRQTDRGRLAYDRITSEVPRQCIFIGTTNDTEYLKDTTGNRRFWPVKVGRVDIEALKRDRDQLWAEAAAREVQGECIRLAEELWPVAAVHQAQRTTTDPYLDAFEHHLGDAPLWEIVNGLASRDEKLGHEARNIMSVKDEATAEQLQKAFVKKLGFKISAADVWNILDVRVGSRTQDTNRRMGEAMRGLGWKRPNDAGTVRINGKLVSGFVRGEAPYEWMVATERDEHGLNVWAAKSGQPPIF